MIASDVLKGLDGIRHGFFTREGGVSTGLYTSLNCGYGSGDAQQNVRENRHRVPAILGAPQCAPLTVRQVHSNKVIVAEAPWTPDDAPEGDAIVTSMRGLPIGVLTADCTPILFCDPQAGLAGAAHAGWRGAKAGIIDNVIETMESLGAKRKQIYAAVGPAISTSAYEVGRDFEAAFIEDDAINEMFFSEAGASGKPHFDLPSYCGWKLKQAALAGIDSIGLCTFLNESLFYSYRRSVHRNEGDYGRQISAIVLM